MELPAEVGLYNGTLGLKGGKGTLVAVSPHGYYEVKLQFGERVHRVLLPIAETVVVFRQPELEYANDLEIER